MVICEHGPSVVWLVVIVRRGREAPGGRNLLNLNRYSDNTRLIYAVVVEKTPVQSTNVMSSSSVHIAEAQICNAYSALFNLAS